MQKQILHLLLLPLFFLSATLIAQPRYIQSNIGSNTAPIYVDREAGFLTKTIQAVTSFPAGGATWQWFGRTYNIYSLQYEPAVDTAIWRCQLPNQSIAFNTAITPALRQASAIRHSNRGGYPGRMPAVTAGKYYTFNIRGSSPAPLIGYRMAVLETDFLPVKLDTTSLYLNSCRLPVATQYIVNDTVSIKATFSNGPLHTGEYAYVAYSTDNFTTTSVAQMTANGGSSAKYTIPGNTFPLGQLVLYYVFTSNKDLTFLQQNRADIDLYSLSTTKNVNTNFVPNYYRIQYSSSVYSVSITTGRNSRNPFCLAYNRTDTLRLYPRSTSITCDTTGGAFISYSWRGPAPANQTYSTPTEYSADTAIFAVNTGVYYVTATCTATGCSATTSLNLTAYAEINPNARNLVPQSGCSNSSGIVTCAPTGGLPPYVGYSWRWGGGLEGTSQNQAGIAGSVHAVVVTDAAGCTAVGTATIPDNPNIQEPLISNAIVIRSACFGNNAGAVGVIHPANAPCTGCTYAWSDAAIGNIRVSTAVLPPNTYTVTITNAAGTCRNTASMTLSEPPLQVVNLRKAPNCFKFGTPFNGRIFTTVTGGTNPKPGLRFVGGVLVNPPDWPRYKWSTGITGHEDSTAFEPRTLTNLGNGCYTVTVTDYNGCTATSSICIDSVFTLQTTPLSAPTCFLGRTGAAAVVPTPAIAISPQYTYRWSITTSNYRDTARFLSAGTQTVTVTAYSGCTASATVVVPPNNNPMTFGLVKSPASYPCAGQLNGIIAVVNPQGDPVGGYTYSWQQIGAGTTIGFTTRNDTISNIRGNFTYQVTVTSTYGCWATASTMITQDVVTVSPQSATVDIRCTGEGNGVMNVTVPGGNPNDYTYNWWFNGVNTGNSTPNRTGLSTGVYGVEVTETATGCQGYADGFINEPAALLSASLKPNSIRPVDCFGGNNGAAIILATGGAGGYTYNWTPTAPPLDTATTLEARTYTVRVTDKNGCSKVISNIIVPGPSSPMLLTLTTRNKACGIEPTGRVCVTAIQNATAPYTYLWNDAAPPQTDSCASGLLTGNYAVTVTDSKGCTASTNTTIPSVAVDLMVRDTTIDNGQTVVPFVATNTADPFTVLWTPATGVSNAEDLNPSIRPTATTTYTVSIRKNGCVLDKNLKITIRYRDGYSIPTAFLPTGTQLENQYFKPLGNGFTVKAFRIFNRWGELLYDNATGNGWDGTYKGEPQPAGTYVYVIEYLDQNNTAKQDSGEVTLLR